MTIAAFNEIRMFLHMPVANVPASLMAAQALERRVALMPASPHVADVRQMVAHLERAVEEPERRAQVLEILDRLEAGLPRNDVGSHPSVSAIPFRGTSEPVEPSGRGVTQTLRILLDGRRDRRLPLSEIVATAVVHGELPLARAVRRFSEDFLSFRRWEGQETPESEFLAELEGRYPPLYLERPQMQKIRSLLRQGRLGEIPAELERVGADIDLFLSPLFFELAGYMNRKAPHLLLQPFMDLLHARLASLEAGSLDANPRHFSPEIYHAINTRDFREYSGALFGEDPLFWMGVDLRPGETALGRWLKDLPHGAVVADWGGGAGVFGMHLKAWRRDLLVYVNDLNPPEEILWPERDGEQIARLRASGVTYLTGDAMTVSLPEGVEADANISVLLTPYLPDPLRFIARLYNQTRPGGLLAVTLPPAMYDVTIGRNEPLSGVEGLMHDLWSFKVEARRMRGGDTLVLRRPDRRRLAPVARLVRSHRVTRGRPYPFETFYWPEEHPKGRWAVLK